MPTCENIRQDRGREGSGIWMNLSVVKFNSPFTHKGVFGKGGGMDKIINDKQFYIYKFMDTYSDWKRYIRRGYFLIDLKFWLMDNG